VDDNTISQNPSSFINLNSKISETKRHSVEKPFEEEKLDTFSKNDKIAAISPNKVMPF
jgi:hypothetical protein